MKLRHKETGALASAGSFNTHALFEIHVYFEDDGGADSDYPRNYEVWLEKSQQWKCLSQAFSDHDVITDNYNTHFFEPENDEDGERGFTL